MKYKLEGVGRSKRVLKGGDIRWGEMIEQEEGEERMTGSQKGREW